MKWPLGFLLIFGAAGAGAADDSALINLLPSGAQSTFGVHLKAVMESDIAKMASSQLQQAATGWPKNLTVAGFDPLRDLDEVVVASSGEGQQGKILIVASGRFGAVQPPAGAASYNGVPVADLPGQPKMSLAILSPNLALGGDITEVHAAIDRWQHPSEADSSWSSRVREYRTQYDIWGIADQLSGLTSRFPETGKSQTLDSIDKMQFGINLKLGIELVGEVHLRSAQDAAQLSNSLKLVEGMLQSAEAKMGGTKLTIGGEGQTLKVALSISEEELKKRIEEQKDTLKAAAARGYQAARTSQLQADPEPVAPPAAPTHSGAAVRSPATGLRIQSSDSGPSPAPNRPAPSGTTVFTLPGAPK
jgi:hypothetical protein